MCHKLQSQESERRQQATTPTTSDSNPIGNNVVPSLTSSTTAAAAAAAATTATVPAIEPSGEEQTDGGPEESAATLLQPAGDEGTPADTEQRTDLITLDFRHATLVPQPSEPLIRSIAHMTVNHQKSTPLPLPEHTPPGKRSETGLPSRPPNTNLLNPTLWSHAELHQAAAGAKQMVWILCH